LKENLKENIFIFNEIKKRRDYLEYKTLLLFLFILNLPLAIYTSFFGVRSIIIPKFI